MRDFVGMEHLFDMDYAKRTDHRFQSIGVPMDKDWAAIGRRFHQDQQDATRKQPWWTMTDTAWVVCLHRGGAVDRETTKRLLEALERLRQENSGTSGEDRLAPLLGGDMKTASIVNYGRTLQEPMSRLQLRAKMIDIADDLLLLLETVHRLAVENLDAIMPGYTHLNHGQPVTFAHYLVSVFDGLHRGLEQFELAYRHTNRNTGGCGSCSGTTWPVDRGLLTRLLGFDETVEPTYDCEAAQDHSLSALFALTNICVLLSQVAMNLNIWAMDEIDMIRTNPSWAGVSSFMPQKADSGSNFERTRVKAADVVGEMVKCVVQLQGEPHADMQAMFQLPGRAMLGMAHARVCFGWITAMLNNIFPQKERMLAITRAGYSCATELASYLVRESGYGNRRAHSIVATMVRQARVRALKSYECTGDMLDEAATFLGEEPPGLSTETVLRCLDPREFIKSHVHMGGTAPEETQRLLNARRQRLDQATERQADRKARVAAGDELLRSEVVEICGT